MSNLWFSVGCVVVVGWGDGGACRSGWISGVAVGVVGVAGVAVVVVHFKRSLGFSMLLILQNCLVFLSTHRL